MTRTSEEIEKDVEHQRRRVEDKLTQLKERMSLGQIAEQASHYVRGDDFRQAAGNLGRQARDNPLALSLIAAGVGWMMLGSARSDDDDYRFGGQHAAEGKAGTMTSSNKSTTTSAGDALHSAMESGRRGLHDARDGVAKAGRSVKSTASRQSRRVSSGASSLSRMVERDPLLVGGLALLAGAAIGMMLPATRTENRYVGKVRDDLMEGARDQAAQMTEKAVHVAEDAARSAKDAVVDTLKTGSSGETSSKIGTAPTSASDTSFQPSSTFRPSNP